MQQTVGELRLRNVFQREDGTVLARWGGPHSFEPKPPLLETMTVVYNGTTICELDGWAEVVYNGTTTCELDGWAEARPRSTPRIRRQ